VTLYQLRQPTETKFVISKFNDDFDLLSRYDIDIGPKGGINCTCPAATRRGPKHGFNCRHRDILKQFQRTGHIDDGWFFCFETEQWREPIE
jgi:hypothetical protein